MTRNYQALTAWLDTMRSQPFDWNGNCCTAFALGAMKAQFGSHPDPKAKWSTQTGAARVIKRLGGMEKAVSGILEPTPIGQAMRGDIAGVTDPDHELLLMVIEGVNLAGPGEHGISRLPRSLMVKAWRAAPGNSK